MSFTTALIIMLCSLFLYSKVQQRSIEVAVGCVSVAILSLVIAIVIAPWQIQLILVMGALVSSSLTRVDLF